MEKYRKKPVVIEAVQWDGTEIGAKRILAWVKGDWSDYEGGRYIPGDSSEPPELQISTLEDGRSGVATHVASPGDWIIKGVKGEFYPCKPDIFAATYDPAGPEEE